MSCGSDGAGQSPPTAPLRGQSLIIMTRSRAPYNAGNGPGWRVGFGPDDTWLLMVRPSDWENSTYNPSRCRNATRSRDPWTTRTISTPEESGVYSTSIFSKPEIGNIRSDSKLECGSRRGRPIWEWVDSNAKVSWAATRKRWPVSGLAWVAR